MDFTSLSLSPDETVAYTRDILNTMREALVLLDAELRVRAVNRAFYRTFQVTPSDTLGHPIGQLGSGQWDLPPLRRLLTDVLEEGRTFKDFEVTHDFPVIGARTMLLNARRLGHEAEGQGPTILLVIQDVTGLKETQAELHALKEELEERVARRTSELAAANEELEAFAYSVSHDLRAPLRALAGFSQALLEDYLDVLDEEGQEYLGYIQEAADQMSNLIDDLLDLSRVTRSDMQYEQVDLSHLARSIVSELDVGEPERHVCVEIDDGMEAEGDPTLLATVLRNLLGNAWKYTRREPEPHITFGTCRQEGTTTFYVRDNGVGFDMTYADKLFRPFSRLHSDHEFEGNGIGLATAARILKRHGGRLWAEAEEGQGATFYFSLRASSSTSD